MKKFLSTVLALVMVLTTFAMLVPNALAAATEQNIEAKVLYEENFDDLEGELPAEILAGANMKDETAGMERFLSVQNGKLKYGSTYSKRESYVVLTDDRLLNGYTVECDVTYLETTDAEGDVAISFHTKGGTGHQGYVSQIRYNGGIVSGANNGAWKVTGTVIGGGNANTPGTAMKGAVNQAEAATINLKDVTMHVKVEFDKANRTVDTYVNNVLVAESGAISEEYDALFTNQFRLEIYETLVAKIDNLKVTTMGASPEVLLNETFESAALLSADAGNRQNKQAFLTALNWTMSEECLGNGEMFRCDNGALVLGKYSTDTISGEEQLILVENSVDAKNGFVVEYDFEFIDTSGGGTSGLGISIHSAKSAGASGTKNGWVSQFRWGKVVLNGANVAGSWGEQGVQYNGDKTYNNNHIQDVTPGRADAMQKSRVAVKAVFDPAAGYVTTYAKVYTGEALTWTEADAVQKSPYLGEYKDLLDGTVRLVIDTKVAMYVDNIKVTALEKTPNVYGYQVSTANAANIRLLGVIDNDIFTKAEKVGFRVTMTKAGDVTATKDIDCEYVYSSITQWGADTPTQAADMLFGASHIYALHVNGIDEAVTIEVTPYYVDEGVTYFGDAATIEYDPAA